MNPLLWSNLQTEHKQLIMNHVKYPKGPESLLHRQDSLDLNGLLTSPKVLYCEKCGFASTQTEDFENHMREHGTPFYCFYCNHVSYSKKELEIHLLQHKFPFRCQFCGHGYMRRAHLLKHIQRWHSKDAGPELNHAQTTLPETLSLSTAFAPGVHRTSVPTVKVRIPVPVARNDHGIKGRQHSKRVDLNVIHAPKLSSELMSPGKNFVQHNMALTVPLPEEVSIPAGCVVELIEVKTVNGTKELKLRLVSQQENKSVLDDTVLPHSASVNPLSSAVNHQHLLKLGNAEKSSVNRRIYTAKDVHVERPATYQTIAAQTALNTFQRGMSGTKRTLKESLIRNVDIPYALPTKVPRITVYPTRQDVDAPITQTVTLKPRTEYPTPVITGRVAKEISSAAIPASKGTLSSCKPTHRENNTVVECTAFPPELQVAVKEEPNDPGNKTTATPEIKQEPLKRNDQTRRSTTSPSISSSVSTTALASTTTQIFSECKRENVAVDSTILMTMLKRPGSILLDPESTKKTKMEDNLSPHKSSIWSASGPGCNRRFEAFPVISSVFSLSQQQDEVQSSIRPLVKELRGIVMRKESPSVQVSADRTEIRGAITEPKEEVESTIHCVPKDKKDNAGTGKGLLTEGSCDVTSPPSKHCSQQTQTQAKTYYVKEETSSTKGKDGNQNNQIPTTQREPLTAQQQACINNTPNISPVAGDSQGHLPQSAFRREDSSSKFLTVSLERMQMDFWTKKIPKLSKTRIPSPVRGLCHKAFLYPAPLRLGQPVIRPGPNQPVVVLNHPKPIVPKRTEVDHLSEPLVSTEVLPKCQILKMRLSKVMGEKYEVIGCTVGFFP
ncbi:uncharacterized protein znf518b [Gadus morhua]|uniref:uncharacterized protein znf518b n=1 Tax=Gadus morhua TaxID=8049 RepID=UPI0011B7B8E8|nr:uncharacterized protein LOC115552129 [Gadus morhua]